MSVAKKSSFTSIQNVVKQYQLQDKGGHITQEFQDFGYRLALTLDDMKHKSLYIKMAKQYNRSLLEQALRFVSDAQARNKARLFMWKVKQLKSETKHE